MNWTKMCTWKTREPRTFALILQGRAFQFTFDERVCGQKRPEGPSEMISEDIYGHVFGFSPTLGLSLKE